MQVCQVAKSAQDRQGQDACVKQVVTAIDRIQIVVQEPKVGDRAGKPVMTTEIAKMS